jgi:hypothetical protein
MAFNKIEIEFEGPSLKWRNINTEKENVWEYFLARNIKSITTDWRLDAKVAQSDGSFTSTYPFEKKFEVRINFIDENGSSPFAFDIQNVDNQPTWTADKAGLFTAVADINSWIGSTVGDMSGLATESTLQDVLTAIQNQKDRELVRDEFTAIADNIGIGYSVGDHLSRISYFDISGGTSTLVDTFWFNHTTDTIIGAPLDTEIIGEDSGIVPAPGVVGTEITTDGAVPFIFDSDTVLIENKTNGDITVTLNGILGNDYVVLKDTSKTVNIDVPHITDLSVAGIGVGTVYITYSRSK